MLSLEEGTSLLSVEAHGGQGAEAGTKVDEMIRMVSMGAIRAKHMKLDPGLADVGEVSSEYMKRIGVDTKKTRTYDAIKLISADSIKEEAAAKARGELFDPVRHLGEKGQINMASNAALMHFYGQERIGALAPVEAEARKIQDPKA